MHRFICNILHHVRSSESLQNAQSVSSIQGRQHLAMLSTQPWMQTTADAYHICPALVTDCMLVISRCSLWGACNPPLQMLASCRR
jgi:hypothetical protein